ncbi:hypothetical protein KZZ52_09210 [Dactylosporangium sp. AC04546]|uniref:hypothetical protein n=1 Tax=Dactylosporangium sp. AC04546 TaxID=2862460 RepID=UPI001EE09CD1|nr:hypothetical protein [Dactylosporangium sp. AC04546]WVK85546.1 hypothetical protein KZZ52_09210 [Dactylosporangium sp. AC04546]
MAVEFVHEDHILSLEGRVLEVFSRHTNGESHRFHVAFLGVFVKPKGDRYKVQLGKPMGEMVLPAVTLTLDAAEFERFRAFIALATAARDGAA